MRHCIIVVGGHINDIFAKEFIEKERPELCIAADSGMNFFYRNKLTPDWIIGDFDSASSEALDYFGGQPDISWIRLNPVKDDTDTESAIRKAIALGAEKITLLGATGTRIDHLLGNIELLGIGLQNHIPIQIVDERNRIRMIGAGITIEKEKQFGKFVSLIPYTNIVKGLTLTGFKYPLDHYDFRGFCSLGVSNEIIAESAQITFEDGILIVIEARN